MNNDPSYNRPYFSEGRVQHWLRTLAMLVVFVVLIDGVVKLVKEWRRRKVSGTVEQTPFGQLVGKFAVKMLWVVLLALLLVSAPLAVVLFLIWRFKQKSRTTP